MNSFEETLSQYGTYFEELRQAILTVTKVFVGVFALGFFATSPAVRFILEHVRISGVTVVTTSPFQLVELAMSVGFFCACVVVVPLFVFRVYSFLKPGLFPAERTFFAWSAPFGLGLFITGFTYGCVMLYYAIKIIAQVNIGLGVSNYWDISSFISQMVLTSALLGLLFLFPLVITFLVRLGIVDAAFLKSKRKHAIAGIFILVSLLPPTDGVSLILMAVPMIIIFELTVVFNKGKNRGRLLTV
ncbi:twin-arginine translocase subunit TatC [Candidatus Campbellbacteria bacterium]|nr:MAG: twin-arginine translocase subunit TatC [Candidatus Campbellbacteria bacterium]